MVGEADAFDVSADASADSSAIKGSETFAATGDAPEAPTVPTMSAETPSGTSGAAATLAASSGKYQPEGLPPMQWSTPQRGTDASASVDMPGKPPIAGGSTKMPSMSGGLKTPSMSGGVDAPSMSGGADVNAPSMSGGVDVDAPSMSGGVDAGAPSMSGGLDVPSSSVSVSKPTTSDTGSVSADGATIAATGTDATPVLTLPQSKGGGGTVAAAPSPSVGVSVSGSSPSPATKIAARSPAASAYVARITTPKADKGATPEPEPELKRLSAGGGLVSRLTAAIEHRGPSPVVRRDGAGSFDGGGVPTVEV